MAGFQWGILIPLGVICLIIGLCLVYPGYQKQVNLETRGVVAIATPTWISEEKIDGVITNHVKYQFQTPASDTWYSHRSCFGLFEAWKYINDAQLAELKRSHTFKVVYDPQDPWTNAPVGATYYEAYSDAGVFGCIGMILIAKSCMWRARARRLRRLGREW